MPIFTSYAACTDIYGDDDNELQVNTQDSKIPPQSSTASAKASTLSPTIKQEFTTRSLPAKPTAGPSNPNIDNLSYSAQIAQQFSAYQQTPSQERQQRQDLSHTISGSRGNPPSTLVQSSIPTLGTSNGASDGGVFGKKPSEMHDAG